MYDKKAQRYVMEIKSKYIPRQIIFYPNKTIKEIFKLYHKEDSYKLLGGVLVIIHS